MKKLIALVLAGVMAFALPVMAAPSPSAAVVAEQEATTTVDPVAQATAAERGMTVEEVINNVSVSLPGVAEVTPVGQGGHVIINGAPSNMTFVLSRPTLAVVNSAKALGGKLLNVVQTQSSVHKFTTARVNFWAQGVKAGQNIKVYQLINGAWVEIPVVEIREDHVVVDMTQHGVLAFVEVPVVAAE